MSAKPRERDACNQGSIALSRAYPFVLLPLPPTMFLEFLLQFVLLGVGFVRIDFLIFSFGFILLFS